MVTKGERFERKGQVEGVGQETDESCRQETRKREKGGKLVSVWGKGGGL